MEQAFIPLSMMMPRKSRSAEPMMKLASVVISLSDECNISCTYCFESRSSSNFRQSAHFDRILNDVISALNRSSEPVAVVSFYGGEPLLQYQLLKEVVQRLEGQVKKPIRFGLTTNGSLFNQERLDFLLDHGFFIQISIDGPPDVTDLHRKRRNGRGAAATQRMIMSRVRSLPKVSGRMTVTPANVSSFSRSIAYLAEIGLDNPTRRIRFDFDLTASWGESDLALFEKESAAGMEFLRACYSRGIKIYIEPLDRALKSGARSTPYCGAGVSTVHVTPTGELYPCNRLTPSHDSGFVNLKLGEGEVDAARVSAVREVILPSLERKPECLSCSARKYCDQVCPARVHASSGSFAKVSETHCSLTRSVCAMALSLKQDLDPVCRATIGETYGSGSVFLPRPLFEEVGTETVLSVGQNGTL